MTGFLIGKCDPCDALIIDEINRDDPDWLVCRGCGAKLAPFTQSGNKLSGRIWRNGMSFTKGKLAKVLLQFNEQHDRGGALVRHERVMDYANNRYVEKVATYDGDEVIHHCDEALTDHQGHGSARR